MPRTPSCLCLVVLVVAAALVTACSETGTATPRPLATMATPVVATPQPPDNTAPETVLVTAVPTASPAPGTRRNPTPFGKPAALGDGWTLLVLGVIPDATEAVLAENQFNEPPEAGEQFFIVRVAMSFDAPGSDYLSPGVRLRLLGDSAVAYTTYNDSCGVVPDRLPDTEVFTGGTVTGNVCWSVKSSDVKSLVLFDDSPDVGTDDRVFFALDDPTAALVPSATATVTGTGGRWVTVRRNALAVSSPTKPPVSDVFTFGTIPR